MAQDPVCGMEAKGSAESTIEYNGAKYEFCSPPYQEKFEAAADKYISSTPEKSQNTYGEAKDGTERTQH